MKILIVEDNQINREFLSAIMEQFGDCAAVETGEDALEAFSNALSESAPFNLVFMDILLPGIDGQRALEKMRALEKDNGLAGEKAAKVIMTSALDDHKNISRAFFQGQAICYLTKPFTVDKVTKELRKFGLID